MKDYDKNKEFPYLQYWNVNNLSNWTFSQKLPVNNFVWIKDTSQFNEDFIQNYNEESNEGYFLEVNIQYIAKLHELHNDLLVFIWKNENQKVEKLVANLHDENEYVLHIRKLKKTLNRG